MGISRRKLILGAGAGAVLVAGGATIGPMLMRGGTVGPAVSRARRVDTDSELPVSADVVIVGGGMLGVASALFLMDKGLSVVICEKGEVAAEQSSRAFGWITSHGLAPQMIELANQSKGLWHGMNERLGVDTSYRRNGLVQLLATDEQIAAEQAWVEAARRFSPIDTRFIEGEELARRIPGATTRWKSALYQESDGGVEPSIATSSIAGGLRERGLRIVANCAVRTLETTAGKVSGVVTEKGEIRAGTVVVAGGSWSRLFCGNAGVDLPLLATYLSQQRLSRVDGPIGCGAGGLAAWRQEVGGTYCLGGGGLTAAVTRESFQLLSEFLPALRQMGDAMQLSLGSDLYQSFRVPQSWSSNETTPFEIARITAPTPDEAVLDRMLASTRAEFPVFAQAQVIERWGGTISVAPDMAPIVSGVSAKPGLFVATGFTFGLTLGPAAGQLLADLVTGDKPKVDPTPFRLERFTAA